MPSRKQNPHNETLKKASAKIAAVPSHAQRVREAGSTFVKNLSRPKHSEPNPKPDGGKNI